MNKQDPESLNNTNSRAFECTQRSVRTVTKRICDLVSRLKSSFQTAIMVIKITIETFLQNFTKSVPNLIFVCSTNTQIIVLSVLASSFKRDSAQTFLCEKSVCPSGTENEVRAYAKCLMKNVRFCSRCKLRLYGHSKQNCHPAQSSACQLQSTVKQ